MRPACPPERPFAIDVLARLQRRLGRRIVRRHAHDDGDRVDLRRGDHLAVVVEGQPGPQAWRAASALSALVVRTAVNSTSVLACTAGRWDRADHVPLTLAPIRPNRILSGMSLPPRENPYGRRGML